MKKLAETLLLAVLFVAGGCKQRGSVDGLRSIDVEAELACAFSDATEMGSLAIGGQQLDVPNWKITSSLALASNAAYKDQKYIRSKAIEWGFTKTDIFESDTMSAFLISNEKCAVLSFRGTDITSIRDIFVDLNAAQELVPGGAIHSGFFHALKRLKIKIDPGIKEHQVDKKIFWVTGHSLGGALAGVYAFKSEIDYPIFRKGPEIARIVTFGQPLFADDGVAKIMREAFIGRYFRVVNDSDVIATIPYWFTHFGSFIWMKSEQVEFHPDLKVFGGPGGGIRPADIPPELQPTKKAFDEFMANAENLNASDSPRTGPNGEPVFGAWLPKMFEDHRMNNYESRIETEVSKFH